MSQSDKDQISTAVTILMSRCISFRTVQFIRRSFVILIVPCVRVNHNWFKSLASVPVRLNLRISGWLYKIPWCQ